MTKARKVTDTEIAAKGYQKEGEGYIKYRNSSDSDKDKGIRFQSDKYKNKESVEKDINSLSYRSLPKYKKGGKVKKTGPAVLHKGERVLTKKQAAKPAIKLAVKRVSKRK